MWRAVKRRANWQLKSVKEGNTYLLCSFEIKFVDLKTMIVTDALLKGLSRVWVVVVGGAGEGGLEESCDLQKLHLLHISHKLTNVSTAFKYVYLFFFTNKTLWWIKTVFNFSLYKKYFTISIQNVNRKKKIP